MGFDNISVCVICFVASEPFLCTWTISSYLLCHMGKAFVVFTRIFFFFYKKNIVPLSTEQEEIGANKNTIKFHLNARRHFFHVRLVKHRNRLPRDVAEPPSVEIFKNCLDTILGNLSYLTLLGQWGWTGGSQASLVL